MAYDPTPWDDIDFAAGRRTEATHQVHFPGRDGQLWEIALSEKNYSALWAFLDDYIGHARKTGLQVPKIPDAYRVTSFTSTTKTSAKAAGAPKVKPAKKAIEEALPVKNDPAGDYISLRTLSPDQVIPVQFWQTPKGASNRVKHLLKEMRGDLREYMGKERNGLGAISHEQAYTWARENSTRVFDLGQLW